MRLHVLVGLHRGQGACIVARGLHRGQGPASWPVACCFLQTASRWQLCARARVSNVMHAPSLGCWNVRAAAGWCPLPWPLPNIDRHWHAPLPHECDN